MRAKLGILRPFLSLPRVMARVLLPLFLGTFPGFALAARDAIVNVDKAIIYSDVQRSSPIGYARKGKLVRVGDLEREKRQVVPVVVSGKIGYIAVDDLLFEDDLKKKLSEAEDKASSVSRYRESTLKRYGEHFMMGYTRFAASENKDEAADRVGDDWTFNGGFVKGEVRTEKERLGLVFMLEYLFAENPEEKFRMFEFGLGGSLALINARRFKLKAEVFGLMVPWAQYENAPLFTLNGYGVGALAQGTMIIFISESVGFEAQAGVQSVKIFGIDRPSPFKEFNPLFTGTRLSGALVFRF